MPRIGREFATYCDLLIGVDRSHATYSASEYTCMSEILLLIRSDMSIAQTCSSTRYAHQTENSIGQCVCVSVCRSVCVCVCVCVLFPVSCLLCVCVSLSLCLSVSLSPVSCLVLCLVSCVLSFVSCVMCPVPCVTFLVSCLLCHVSCLLSLVYVPSLSLSLSLALSVCLSITAFLCLGKNTMSSASDLWKGACFSFCLGLSVAWLVFLSRVKPHRQSPAAKAFLHRMQPFVILIKT